jgi:hypothetical protein
MGSIHNIEQALLVVYCFVSQYLQTHPRLAAWRRSPNAHPALTDAEVITIALMQGVLGCTTLKATYRYIAANHADAFPHLVSYARWIVRLHALQALVGRLVQAALSSHRMPARVYLVDTKPLPLCKLARTARVRLLREEGAYWGKSSTGWYFGFKLHILMHKNGGILAVVLTPANVSDLDPDVLCTLSESVLGGLLLGDAGYQSRPMRRFLKQETGMGLLTAPDVANKERRGFLHQKRKRIETEFSRLWRQCLDQVFSRSFAGLWNTLLLKMLHYNLCLAHIL